MLKKIFLLTGVAVSFFLNGGEKSTIEEKCVVEYQELGSSQEKVEELLHQYGIIAIRGVPGFVETYERFIEEARAFVSLSEEEKSKCTPTDAFSRGWSFGIEKFKGRLDTFKGSYYVAIPEGCDGKECLWPESKSFKEAYLNLSSLIYQTGKELMPQVGLDLDQVTGMARMLYYAPVNENTNDTNPNWCAEHRDHSVITGLCPAIFVKGGEIVSKPSNCGLYVKGESVSFPNDVLIFQIGETAQLITDGKITATDHYVKKAIGDYERYTMALFFDCDKEISIYSSVTEYNDRFRQGMTYGEWSEASFNKYKKENEESS